MINFDSISDIQGQLDSSLKMGIQHFCHLIAKLQQIQKAYDSCFADGCRVSVADIALRGEKIELGALFKNVPLARFLEIGKMLRAVLQQPEDDVDLSGFVAFASTAKRPSLFLSFLLRAQFRAAFSRKPVMSLRTGGFPQILAAFFASCGFYGELERFFSVYAKTKQHQAPYSASFYFGWMAKVAEDFQAFDAFYLFAQEFGAAHEIAPNREIAKQFSNNCIFPGSFAIVPKFAPGRAEEIRAMKNELQKHIETFGVAAAFSRFSAFALRHCTHREVCAQWLGKKMDSLFELFCVVCPQQYHVYTIVKNKQTTGTIRINKKFVCNQTSAGPKMAMFIESDNAFTDSDAEQLLCLFAVYDYAGRTPQKGEKLVVEFGGKIQTLSMKL